MEMYTLNQPDQNNSQINRSKLKRSWYKKWWGVLLLVFLSIFLVLAVAFSFYVYSLIRQINSPVGQANGMTKNINSLISVDDPTFGPRDSKVVFIEFGDFQCSACQAAHPVVKKLMDNYGSQVLFVFKDFPLIQLHPQAALAALAGQCAKDQGNFWQMYDKMYQGDSALSELDLKTYALQLGLNSLEFSSCLNSAKHLDSIQSDFDLGVKLGIDSTPTFLINNNIVRGTARLAEFDRIIVAELNK